MDYSKIVKIIETSDVQKANELLNSEWILLSSGFCKGEFPGQDFHLYSLGLPKGIPDNTKDDKSDEPKYDLGF